MKVCVIGLGYVGIPLLERALEVGFNVFGVDIDEKKIEKIVNNELDEYYLSDPHILQDSLKKGKLSVGIDYSVVKKCDVVIYALPTPLSKTRDPDVSYILNALNRSLPFFKNGQLLVLESTTYPGFTREVMAKIVENSGLKVGEDIFVAFSPERIDPGNTKYTLKNTPKVVAAITKKGLLKCVSFYEKMVDTVVPVSSTDTAEMVKLLENTYRSVNIALINEFAIAARKLSLDIWEVIDAAKTKPFGFMAFYPGPGLGGHCIPVDPLYLSWRMRTFGIPFRFIELADSINQSMPDIVVDMIASALNFENLAVSGSKILILGVTYKKDVADTRESPAITIMEELLKRNAEVYFHDPYIKELKINGEVLTSINFEKELTPFDVVCVLQDHSYYDWERVVRESKIIIDTRNATKNTNRLGRKIYLL